MGRNQEALEHVDRSIEILETGLGAAHPELATQLSNRGEILNALGRYREARGSFEKARIIWERELGLDNRNLAYALTGIGHSFIAEGDTDQRARAARARLQDPRRAGERRRSTGRDPIRPGAGAVGLGRERARARLLAEQARDTYAKSVARSKLAEVQSWLRGHGAG